jgi:hypothetical protein
MHCIGKWSLLASVSFALTDTTVSNYVGACTLHGTHCSFHLVLPVGGWIYDHQLYTVYHHMAMSTSCCKSLCRLAGDAHYSRIHPWRHFVSKYFQRILYGLLLHDSMLIAVRFAEIWLVLICCLRKTVFLRSKVLLK